MAAHSKGNAEVVSEPPQRIERLLDLLPVAVLLVEVGTGRVAFANRRAEMLGLNPVKGAFTPCALLDATGKPLTPDKHPIQIVAFGGTLDNEHYVCQTAGGVRHYLVSCGAMAHLFDHVSISTLTFIDVTGVTETEAELRRAVAARDDFFSIASHELKDPLFSLQLTKDLLLHRLQRSGDVPPEELRRNLGIIDRQVERLAQLVENLLDVSRIANRPNHLDLDAFDLCDLVHEVAGKFQGIASHAGVRLLTDPCQRIIGYWDRTKVEQIVSNLLSNAIKYGDGKPVLLRVHADDSAAFIEVKDDGVGIRAEDQERIFHRFERASSGHVKKSLGLGLFIVKSLVESHGGTIHVRSKPGQGSTFTVTLPRHRLGKTG